MASATNSNIVRDTCKKVEEIEPYKLVSYNFCVTVLGSDPRSSNATTVVDLSSISIEISVSRIKSILTTIEGLLKDPKFDPPTKSCLSACQTLYLDAQSQLSKYAMDALKKGDYGLANDVAGGALEMSLTCETGFEDLKRVSPPALSKENADFYYLGGLSVFLTHILLK